MARPGWGSWKHFWVGFVLGGLFAAFGGEGRRWR